MDRASRLPSLNGLRAFEVSARAGSFRLAAEEMGVTPGAVAQQVRALEADLGLMLFHREGRGLVLTEAGRGYAGHLRRAFDLIGEATRQLRPEPARVTISVTPSFATRWLIPRLAAFTAAHPGIDLAVLASDRIANFQADGVDLAVRLGAPPFGPGLVADLLLPQELVAVAAPQALALGGLGLLHDAHDLWPQFLGLLPPSARPQAPKNLRFNQTALAIEAALAGQGMALAPRAFVAEDLAAGKLVPCFDVTLRSGADFHLVLPRKARRAAEVLQVRDWLRSQAGP